MIVDDGSAEKTEKYVTRFVNGSLRVYESLKDGLMANNVSIRIKNPKGASFSHLEQITLPIGFMRKTKVAINHEKFWLHGRFLFDFLQVFFLYIR